MKRKITATFLTGIILSSPLWGAENAPQGPGSGDVAEARFNSADSNGDGRISKPEFMDAAAKRAEIAFERMDSNGDGFITEEETAEARQAIRERFRERMEQRRKAGPPESE